jgi:hypothetical protein
MSRARQINRFALAARWQSHDPLNAKRLNPSEAIRQEIDFGKVSLP